MVGFVPDISRAVGDNIIWFGAVTGACIFLIGALAKGVVKLARAWTTLSHRIFAVLDLTEYELQHNGGGSIKDHVAQAAKDSARSLDEVKTLSQQFNSYVLANAKEKEAMWSAVEAIAHSQPPRDQNVDLSLSVTERTPSDEVEKDQPGT